MKFVYMMDDGPKGDIMHLSSLFTAVRFRDDYLIKTSLDKVLAREDLKVLDVGSQEFNDAGYSKILKKSGIDYIGVDVVKGKNVDVVLKDVYNWTEFKDDSVDAIICGQTLEHVEYFWLTMKELVRVLKPNGLLCLIVPSRGAVHKCDKCPTDCWRFNEDGLKALAKMTDLDVLECYTETLDKMEQLPDFSREWLDTVLIGKKRS